MKLRDIRLYIPTLIGILLLGMAVWMKIDALAEAALCADLTCMGKDYSGFTLKVVQGGEPKTVQVVRLGEPTL
ncbi:hypothetical protein ACOR62_07395 [Neisseria lisongii]|uniref:Uncharacterized protein n=1 Tax=Neisseria lisongii TaxID=2912188 RepID=A0AAW5ANV7_9NEIS|nr:hypothetical protein [Neisseria lisongii]MCF7530199.1 hypothetical protein [Neisseria lisongii]